MTHSHHHVSTKDSYDISRNSLIGELSQKIKTESQFLRERLNLEYRTFGREVARQQKSAIQAEIAYVRENAEKIALISTVGPDYDYNTMPSEVMQGMDLKDLDRRAMMAGFPLVVLAWMFVSRKQ